MNPKVIKLREEQEKNVKKIASLQARNKKIDADIISIENTDIIGMVREYGSMKLHSWSKSLEHIRTFTGSKSNKLLAHRAQRWKTTFLTS